MTGFKYGQATGGAHAGMQHGATPATSSRDSAARRADSVVAGHEGHQMSDSARKTATDSIARHSEQMMELHMRMMSDPVIRDRIMADTAMRRMMQEMVTAMPAEHRGHMEAMMREAAPARSDRPTTTRPSPARPANPPTARPADPHAGHQMPAPKATPKKPAPAKKDSMPAIDHSKGRG
jgi:hypothetical protein